MIDVFVHGSRYCPEGLLPDPGLVWAAEVHYPGLLSKALRGRRSKQDTLPPVRPIVPDLDPWYAMRKRYTRPGHPNHDRLVALLQGWDRFFDPDPEILKPGIDNIREQFTGPFRYYAPPKMHGALQLILTDEDEMALQPEDIEPNPEGPRLGVWDALEIGIDAPIESVSMEEVLAFQDCLKLLKPSVVYCSPNTPTGRVAALACLLVDFPYVVMHQPRSSRTLFHPHAMQIVPAANLGISLIGHVDATVAPTEEVPQALRERPVYRLHN